MTLATIDTVESFTNFVSSSTLTVVHFCAEWADQCGPVTEVLKELLKLPEIQNSCTKFAVCDAENLSEISLKYKVDSVPTVILFKNGQPLDRIDGADASQISSKVKALSGGNVNAPKQSLEERLKALINRHNIMVFMKGTRDQPRCGFSRTLIQILNGTGSPYDTFDILTDEEVRQGLKTYSDWPTYPQVYVKGELIGGLDIIKEMLANGELESTLNA
ncbi:glutaredoxin 3 [Danaus plexippus]|uniref:Glutaredoxin grx n=1 Tax=Danaus plexippus plexippus TaxID=278856 RepID=A0A212F1K1_DANPL|nr:glutaredoxin 3 [Danaus plexippus]XP_061384087.1 glutaredoxin 3 [Danaus plexippus]OWR47606.1 putative glutaredoxin grx [Danaus plexippus plexippus]